MINISRGMKTRFHSVLLFQAPSCRQISYKCAICFETLSLSKSSLIDCFSPSLSPPLNHFFEHHSCCCCCRASRSYSVVGSWLVPRKKRTTTGVCMQTKYPFDALFLIFDSREIPTHVPCSRPSSAGLGFWCGSASLRTAGGWVRSGPPAEEDDEWGADGFGAEASLGRSDRRCTMQKMKFYISASGIRRVTISNSGAGKGSRETVAPARRLTSRTLLPVALVLGIVLPFLFVRVAFLVLESAAACSSSTGIVTTSPLSARSVVSRSPDSLLLLRVSWLRWNHVHEQSPSLQPLIDSLTSRNRGHLLPLQTRWLTVLPTKQLDRLLNAGHCICWVASWASDFKILVLFRRLHRLEAFQREWSRPGAYSNQITRMPFIFLLWFYPFVVIKVDEVSMLINRP